VSRTPEVVLATQLATTHQQAIDGGRKLLWQAGLGDNLVESLEYRVGSFTLERMRVKATMGT
jgi:hypothetical protein